MGFFHGFVIAPIMLSMYHSKKRKDSIAIGLGPDSTYKINPDSTYILNPNPTNKINDMNSKLLN
jgi:hypothetical protein